MLFSAAPSPAAVVTTTPAGLGVCAFAGGVFAKYAGVALYATTMRPDGMAVCPQWNSGGDGWRIVVRFRRHARQR